MLSNLGWFMFGAICGFVLISILSAGDDDDK